MVGCRNYRRALQRYSLKSWPATAKGVLYHLGEKNYPAMILAGEDTIVGEVHEINACPACVDELDGIENYEAGREAWNEYNREMIEVHYDGKVETMVAYIYNPGGIYNRHDTLVRIPEGDWRLYLKEHDLTC